MFTLRAFCSLLPLTACACAAASGSFVPLDARHPASAEAAESPIEDPSAFLRAEAEDAASPAPEAASPAAAYACPMHADVTSDRPGYCSECGMALVPREELGHDH